MRLGKALSILTLFTLLLSLCAFAGNDVFNFVHKDYDFVLRISNGRGWYDEMKKVPFFKFVLERKGLGFEDSFLRFLENVRYRSGVSPDVVLDAISSDVLWASKGVEVDIVNFVSFDLNYYLELVRTLGVNAFMIFETKFGRDLPKALSELLSMNLRQSGAYYVLGDSLYGTTVGRYFVLAGSRQALELALRTFNTPEMQLARGSKDFERLKAGTFFLSGFAKPSVIKFSLPGTESVGNGNAESVLIYSTFSAGSFNLTLEQKNKTQQNSKKLNDGISELPIAWNYFLSIPTHQVETILSTVRSWLVGAESEIRRVLSFVEYAAKNSSFSYTAGRIETGEVLFVFEEFGGRDVDVQLQRLGARWDPQKLEWSIQLTNAQVYSFKYLNKLFFGTVSRERYLQLERTRRKMREIPIYFDFSKINTYDLKLIVDVGDFIKSTVGFSVSSKLLFWSYSSGFYTFYRLMLS